MMLYKYIVSLGSILTISLLISSCGQNKKSNSTSPDCGAGYTFANGSCMPSQYAIAPGPGNSCPSGYVFTGQFCTPTNLNVPGAVPGVGYYSDNCTGRTNLSVTGTAAMREFLREGLGVCDRTGTVGGTYDCTAYISGFIDMVIQAPNATSQNLTATFRVGARNNAFGGYGSYGYQLPSTWGEALFGIPSSQTYYGATRNPLQLNMAVSVINNNAGFEARGYGDFLTGANRSLIQIQVDNGKLDNSYGFNYRVLYKGATMFQGNMVRCQSADCGLMRPICSVY